MFTLQADRKRLSALARVIRVAGFAKANSLPILSYLLLSAESGVLTIRGNDLEKTLEVQMPGEGMLAPMLVRARNFQEVLSKCSRFSLDGLRAFTETGSTTLEGFTSSDMIESVPERLRVESPKGFKVWLDKSTLAFAGHAVSTGRVNSALRSMAIDLMSPGRLCLVSTDGFRLAISEMPLSHPFKESEEALALLREDTSGLLEALVGDGEEVSIGLETTGKVASKICFQGKGWSLVSNLASGRYPGWRKVVPAEPERTFRFDRKAFETAVKAASSIHSDYRKNLLVHLSEGQATLLMDDQEEKRESSAGLACQMSGGQDPLEIVVSWEILFDAAKAGTGTMLALKAKDAMGMVAFQTQAENSPYLNTLWFRPQRVNETDSGLKSQLRVRALHAENVNARPAPMSVKARKKEAPKRELRSKTLTEEIPEPTLQEKEQSPEPKVVPKSAKTLAPRPEATEDAVLIYIQDIKAVRALGGRESMVRFPVGKKEGHEFRGIIHFTPLAWLVSAAALKELGVTPITEEEAYAARRRRREARLASKGKTPSVA